MGKLLSFLIFLGFFIACSTGDHRPQDFDRLPDDLTREEAEIRSKQVGFIRYKIELDLTKEENFSGTTTIDFNLLSADQEILRLDFRDGQILALETNGVRIVPVYNGNKILIPTSNFKPGLNKIRLAYTHAYSRSGVGLHRFLDPEDQLPYLYTHFEPFDAHALFPCFDQPDLKANYNLIVLAPGDWELVSAVKESNIQLQVNGAKLWTFPDSDLFSTYLISLFGGPYKIWETTAGKIPLRLLSRQSQAKYVDHAQWFKITQQGLDFYPKYFGTPYPFKKYDQVIVPEFNAGAMENVAAVAFAERFISKGKYTRSNHRYAASVILHEMAHMWFGDLVTMKWWNDLWLNESFASFMSAMAMTSVTEFKEADRVDVAWNLRSAFYDDQLSTTHPIASDVKTTSEALTAFDGISYAKGASALKQLLYVLGDKKFRNGLKGYFEKNKFANTTLKDFLNAQSMASGMDLTQWTEEWLRTTGVNKVSTKYACTAGKVKNFKVVNSLNKYDPVKREHRSKIGLFYSGDGELKIGRVAEITFRDETSIPQFENAPCPDLVLTNLTGHDYSRNVFDENSLKTLKKVGVNSIKDPALRSLVWINLWEMVRDASFSLSEFGSITERALASENDVPLLEVLKKVVVDPYDSETLIGYLKLSPEKDSEWNISLRNTIEHRILSRLSSVAGGSDLQKMWWDGFSAVAFSPESLNKIARHLKGQSEFSGLDLDSERRWGAIINLSTLGHPDALSLAKVELQKDKSDSGERNYLGVLAAQPKIEDKQKWFKIIVGDSSKYSLAQLRSIMKSLFPVDQVEYRSQMSEDFYRSIVKVSKEKELEFQFSFVDYLTPGDCKEPSVKKLEGFLDQTPGLSPPISKTLKTIAESEKRCLAIQKLAAPMEQKP